MRKRLIFLLAILIVYLSISLFRLDEIPGEWFGDISNVHEYVTQILEGQWPFYFFQSPGPFYHYLITPIVILLPNHGYETYKIASVVVGFLGISGTFLFVREIGGKRLALVTTLVMSVSFWYLVYSRLGNSQIVIPALSSFMSFFWARYVKRGRFRNVFWGAVVASFGWYTYPQTFVFPAVFFFFYMLGNIYQKKFTEKFRQSVFILVVLAISAVPFVLMVRSQATTNFSSTGFLGEKILPVFSMARGEFLSKLTSNFTKVALMLHVAGDRIFRVNVPFRSHLDWLSGLLLFAGMLYFAKKKRRLWLVYMFGSMIFFILPSISPALPADQIPSTARTIAITPFVYLLVAAGILWGYELVKQSIASSHRPRSPRRYVGVTVGGVTSLLVSIIFAYMIFLNLRLYFVNYRQGLPERNLAPGKKIAQYIDEEFPSNISLYFASCCWGEWGQPEPKAVVYVIRRPRNYIDHNISGCHEVNPPAVVIFSPHDQEKITLYQKCFPSASLEKIYMDNGAVLYQQLLIKRPV